MRFTRPCLLLLVILICYCGVIPVMGAEPEEVYFYDIYAADVNGAAVYFDNDFMGNISNGALTVSVISKKTRPYYRVRLTMDGFRDAIARLPEPADNLQHVSVFLTMEPTPLQTGVISLSSSPSGATYFLDEEKQGGTPDTISGVSQGTHTITVMRQGYNPWKKTITVQGGETTEVVATLIKERVFGTLSLNSEPEGAEIYIDGWYYGTTPMTIGGIASGPHDIELKKSGYSNIITSVKVTENTVTPVTYPLEPAQSSTDNGCSLTVSSSPTGATVCIDGVSRGMTPVTVTDLNPDIHQVQLTNTGHRDYLDMVSLSDGERRNIDITMEPLPASEYAPAPIISVIFSLVAACALSASAIFLRKPDEEVI